MPLPLGCSKLPAGICGLFVLAWEIYGRDLVGDLNSFPIIPAPNTIAAPIPVNCPSYSFPARRRTLFAACRTPPAPRHI